MTCSCFTRPGGKLQVNYSFHFLPLGKETKSMLKLSFSMTTIGCPLHRAMRRRAPTRPRKPPERRGRAAAARPVPQTIRRSRTTAGRPPTNRPPTWPTSRVRSTGATNPSMRASSRHALGHLPTGYGAPGWRPAPLPDIPPTGRSTVRACRSVIWLDGPARRQRPFGSTSPKGSWVPPRGPRTRGPRAVGQV